MGRLGILIGVTCIAYAIYVPLPKGWLDRKETRIIAFTLTTIQNICDNFVTNTVQQALGYDNWALMRWVFELPKLKQTEGVTVTNETWNGIRVLIFTPDNKKDTFKGPGVVYYHGGGFTLVKPDLYSTFLGPMAKKINAVVIAPDYRKAPQFPFPAAYNDCLMVAKEFIKNADRFGVDKKRIALVGDSAGGNLAAAVSLELQNKIHSQYLIYPVLQFTHYHLPNFESHKHDPVLPERLLNRFRMSYLGFDEDPRMLSILKYHGHLYKDGKFDYDFYEHVNTDNIPARFIKEPFPEFPLTISLKASNNLTSLERNRVKKLLLDPRLAPLAAKDELLQKTPNAYIITCDCDTLRDEAIMYVERLKKLGKVVEHVNIKNAPHGAIRFENVDEYKAASLTLLEAIKTKLIGKK